MTPRTAAGPPAASLDDLFAAYAQADRENSDVWRAEFRRRITAAIEAEAAAPLRDALRGLVEALADARIAADDALDRAGSAADAFEQGTMRPDALDNLHKAEDAARRALDEVEG